MSELQKSIDPRMIGEILAARKWFLLLPFIVCVAVGAWIIEHLPVLYRVQTQVLYEDRSPLAREIERKLLPGSQETGRKRADVRMEEARILRLKVLSEDFLSQIAAEMGLMNHPDAIDRARRTKEETGDPRAPEEIARLNVAASLRRMINITLAGGNIYQITTQGRDQKRIYELATIVNQKLGDVIETEELSRIRAAAEFTRRQIAIYRRRTDGARRNLQEFMESQPSSGSDGTARFNVDREEAGRLAEETGFEIQKLTERIAISRVTLADSYAFDLDAFMRTHPPEIILLRDRLISMEKQLGYLLLDRDWSDPNVITQNGRIGETRSEIQMNLERHAGISLADRSPFVVTMAVEASRDQIVLSALEIRRSTFLDHSVGLTGSDAVERTRRDERYRYLQEQVNVNEELLRSFLSQAAAAKITEAVEMSDEIRTISVLESPKWPKKPVSPNKPQLYGLAVLVGLALGGSLLILREYLDNSLRDVNETEELVGVPILGTIPRIDFDYMPGSRHRLRRGLLYAMLGVIVVGVAVGYYVYLADDRNGSSDEGEAATLMFSGDREDPLS